MDYVNLILSNQRCSSLPEYSESNTKQKTTQLPACRSFTSPCILHTRHTKWTHFNNCRCRKLPNWDQQRRENWQKRHSKWTWRGRSYHSSDGNISLYQGGCCVDSIGGYWCSCYYTALLCHIRMPKKCIYEISKGSWFIWWSHCNRYKRHSGKTSRAFKIYTPTTCPNWSWLYTCSIQNRKKREL